jgi:hypothetical protein
LSDISFVNNIAKGVDVLGVQESPLIYALARVTWESAQDRDAVLNFLVADNG